MADTVCRPTGSPTITLGHQDDLVARTHLKRYRQIADVLARHGMGYLVSAFGLERFVPFQRGLLGHARREAPYTCPEHVRLALEEIGTTFIKLGQVLSTRPDLIPAEDLKELSRLQDAAPAEAWADIEQTITADLDGPISEHFAHLETEPLAAASIGQAHAATLPDGTQVVVKVRRPGVVERAAEDIEILRNLAATASRRWDAARPYDLEGLTEEFAETLQREMDYLQEGRNAERMARNFAGDTGVHIPRVFWETTTSRVLTLERLRGIKVDDLAALDAAGVDRQALALRAARMLLQMVFEDGFFHADPHPGNLFIEKGGRLGLLDFGMVGSVDARTREQLAGLLLAITRRENERLADALLDLGDADGGIDRGRLDRSMFSIPLLSNRFLFVSFPAAAIAHLAVLHVAALQSVFRTEPLAGHARVCRPRPNRDAGPVGR